MLNRYVVMHFKIYQEMVLDAEEETFELDPDEDVLLDIDTDNMALVTRALTLARTDKTSSSIEYVQLKAAWDEPWNNWTQSAVCRELTARKQCLHPQGHQEDSMLWAR
jgi:hypothetical protein